MRSMRVGALLRSVLGVCLFLPHLEGVHPGSPECPCIQPGSPLIAQAAEQFSIMGAPGYGTGGECRQYDKDLAFSGCAGATEVDCPGGDKCYCFEEWCYVDPSTCQMDKVIALHLLVAPLVDHPCHGCVRSRPHGCAPRCLPHCFAALSLSVSLSLSPCLCLCLLNRCLLTRHLLVVVRPGKVLGDWWDGGLGRERVLQGEGF
mmetsp:Transcript_24946/g.59959  ORF Transcript_24946/g.59959 Transcript_24946/m.59959 type:complete len:203 (+) Transcript_24946:127-735(+)